MAPIAVQITVEIVAGVATEPRPEGGKRFAILCGNALTDNPIQTIT